MKYLGMFALGGFVGGFLILGINHMKSLNDFKKLLATVFGAAFSGAVLGFISYLGGQEIDTPLYMYPVGLLLALMWSYGRVAIENLKSTNPSLRLLGWGHIIGLVVINLLVALLVLKPAITEVWKK